MPTQPIPGPRVMIEISRPAALALTHWLSTVPVARIPVTDPSERQALADLLTRLEVVVGEVPVPELAAARTALLEAAGDWVNGGATFSDDGLDATGLTG